MLPENYYLSNFEALTRFVVETYQEFLTAEELAWANTVDALPEPAKRLYVRLLSRKGNAFRIGKLKYPEIVNLKQAGNTLSQLGLARTTAPSELEALLPLVTRPELLKLPELSDMKSASRLSLDERLIELNSTAVLNSLAALDDWIQIEQSEYFELFVMCYFGNRYQDLSEFVLRDLGHQTYETYAIDKQSRAFQTREQIDAHWQYFQCQAQMDNIDVTSAEALIAVELQLPNTVGAKILAEDIHLIRRLDRFRNQIARQLERLQELEAALSLYRKTKMPPSRERQVRLLTHAEKFNDALTVVNSMLLAPIDDSESRFAERHVVSLKRSLGQRVIKPAVFKPFTTKLTLQPSEEDKAERVEWRALQYYQQAGRCYYCENTLVRGALGLFIWDLMYLEIDGAFHHPFQAGPSDLMQPEFVSRRQGFFDERWKELNDPLRFAARVWQNWEEKQGLSNILVHWSHLSEELLSDALIRIPTEHWDALFKRLLNDLRYNGKGLPDLVLFPHDGGYEFIEIKGPGDALQQHQRRWMQYFSQFHIPHRVVHIRYTTKSI